MVIVFGQAPLWECLLRAFLKPPVIVLLFFLPTVFHCSGVFGSDLILVLWFLFLVIGGGSASVLLLFFLLLSRFWASLGDLWTGSGLGSERLFPSSSFVSSALTSISSMSRGSSLEVVPGARRPSSVSTFSDIFVAVLSRWSGKTAVSILSYASL